MIKLYGQMQSRAPRNTWALEEAGVEYEQVPLNPMAGDCQAPEFLAINPNGKVPALVDGDLKLCESMAINFYIAQKYATQLWPASLEDQSRAIQWGFWGMTEIEPPFIQILVEKLFKTDEERDQGVIDAAMEMLPRPLAVLDAHLASSDYLLGGEFTIADLNLASIFTLAAMLQYDLGPYANVQRWLGACLSRPAAQKVQQMAA